MEKKIVHAVTVSKSLSLMDGQLKYLKDKGNETFFISSPGKETPMFSQKEESKPFIVSMEREINITRDIMSLARLILKIRKLSPDIINYGTPKAGLLVSLASFICRVPVRIYTIRGLRLETTTGLKRKILLLTEKVSVICSTKVIAISPSLQNRAIELGIVKPEKVTVLGNGSSNGFPIIKYKETESVVIQVKDLKKKIGITPNDFVLGFVGRMTEDKGLKEIIQSFTTFNNSYPNSKMLIIGEYEDGDPVDEKTKAIIEEHPDILHQGFQKDLLIYYKMMDVLLFLTKREGFGNVAIEASLSGVPVIVSNVTGACDTVINNKTGFLVNQNDINQVITKLEFLIENPIKKKKMGCLAKEWAEVNFDNENIWNDLYELYNKELRKTKRFLKV